MNCNESVQQQPAKQVIYPKLSDGTQTRTITQLNTQSDRRPSLPLYNWRTFIRSSFRSKLPVYINDKE